MKRLRGSVKFREDKDGMEYYTRDDVIFTSGLDDKDSMQWDDKALYHLALCANSPWSDDEMIYSIYSSELPEGLFEWVCRKKIVGYEGITSMIYGYGQTEQEALEDCIKYFNDIQSKYNKDDDYF